MSSGIGSWMTCIDTLSQMSIFLNCATLYFTSKVYVKIFVGDVDKEGRKTDDENNFSTITDGWDLT